MSCNPAIGGIGKSHLAKEVDAMGGLMARAADLAGIHYRVLNSTKGQAVRATRVQTDRDLYRKAIQLFLEQQDNLTILEASVEDLCLKAGKVTGIFTSEGQTIQCNKTILTKAIPEPIIPAPSIPKVVTFDFSTPSGRARNLSADCLLIKRLRIILPATCPVSSSTKYLASILNPESIGIWHPS